MDFNLVVLGGHLAAPPEVRVFESGARLLRYLITVKNDEPRRRVDVLPVTLWDPSDDLLGRESQAGDRLWCVGSAQRRFWDGRDGRRSRIELVAASVSLRDPAGLFPDPSNT
ncbi:MAG TPA: single-stranded DNA-binding protein [Acidimicrobiia bacterium]|nr:single-stranded DNA-binding protein [Acidimicrobiia bacterium]